MNETSLIMLICLIIPLSMMMFVFKNESRVLLLFLLIGILICFMSGVFNEFVFQQYDIERYFLTANVTPMIEEILKAIPLIFYIFLYRPNQKLLLEASLALGIGFATLENFCIMNYAGANISILFAIFRGLGTGLMHGLCSLAIGYALLHFKSNKAIVLPGIIASLSMVIIFHSIYNILVQSDYGIVGVLLPIICYIPFIIYLNNTKLKGEKV